MATTKGLKFFHVDGLPSSGAIDGGIYFDKTHGELAVRNGESWESYSSNVKNVVYNPVTKDKTGNAVGGTLTITYLNGDVVTLDFKDVASKTQVATDIAAAIKEAKDYVNARKVNGKTLNADIVLDGRDIKLDGYKKADAKAAIATTDTVNQALGKLEKAIESTDGNALTQVVAGNGISVTDKGSGHEQTISVKIDATSEKFGENAVLTASTEGLKISGIKTAIDTAIGGLNVTDSAESNRYVSSVSETGGKISVTHADLPVIGVADNDKILSLSGAKIGTTLSIAYDKASKKIHLYGKDATNVSKAISSIDCTDFIKDGMLFDQKVAKAEGASMTVTFPKGDTHNYENLEVGHTYIFLEFNDGLGEGNSKSFDKLDATTLVDVYTAGNGLSLAGNEFSIRLDDSEYLGIASDGNLHFDDTAIHTKISGDITTEIGKLNATKSNTEATITDPSSQIKVTVSEVKGLLTGVTVNAPIFAVPSDIETAKSNLIGSTGDDSTANTINGAKKYADDIVAAAKTAANTYTDSAIQGLDATVEQNKDLTNTESAGIKAKVTEVDGKLTGVEVSIAPNTYAKPADITKAIEALDSNASNKAAGAGDKASTQIKVQVNQVDGKLSAVAVNAPAFDLSGAATTAETNAKVYTDEKIQGLVSTVSQVADAADNATGLALQVVQTDGKLTSISGSMNWCEW